MPNLSRSRPSLRRAGMACCKGSLAALLAIQLPSVVAPSLLPAIHAAVPEGETEKPLILPLNAKVPAIDGMIQPEEWAQAIPLGALTSPSDSAFPKTEAWVSCNGASLFIAIRCGEPTPDKIKTVTIADEKNSSMAGDDHIHIVLDMGNTAKQELYDLRVNAEGTLSHARSFGIRHLPGAWESGASVRSHIGKDAWELEIAIPLQALGHVLQPGEALGINIARTRFAGNEKATLASLRQPFSVHVKELIPIVTTSTHAEEDLGFRSLHRGPFCSWEDGEWRFAINPKQESEIVIRWPNGAKKERRKLAAGPQILSLPFPAKEAEAHRSIELFLAATPGGEPGEPFYRSEHAITDDSNQLTIPETKDPLFEELITKRPEGYSQEGYIVWRHDLQGSPKMNRHDFSMKTGAEFSEEAVFSEWGKEGAIVMASTPLQLTPELLEKAERNGTRYIVYPLFRGSAELGAPLNGGKQPWMLDPRSDEAYLNDVQKIIDLAKKHPCIWGIAAGDEAFEAARTGLRYALLTRSEKPYPELEAADTDAKKRFGFNRYGFPLSLTDPNPFRWIATARWEIDRMFTIQKKVKEMIDTQCPRLRLVSWDPMTSVHARKYERWGSAFDIVTGQVSSNFGFYTKVTADLTRAKELWMCTHIEHYLGNYTPREIEELLSDVFRHGATGLHLYTSNVIKDRIGAGNPLVDRIGAPERWHAVRQILERLRKEPFRVEQKESDTAIFVSTVSLLSQGNTPTPKAEELIALYDILGRKLHQAFTFIDEAAFRPDRAGELARTKTIYLPSAPIVDDAVYNALERYVEEGGRLVVCDPLAFRRRSDGSAREKGMLLPPLKEKGDSPAALPGKRLLSSITGETLEALGQFYSLEADQTDKADAEPERVLAQTEESQPAILTRRVGKGEVEFWAQNPLGPNTAKSASWVSLFTAMQKNAGAAESPIWRFRFPKTEPYLPQYPEGLCVTGNFLEWRQSEPRLTRNASDVQGTYSLSTPPLRDAEAADVEIPFSQGVLHDRYKGALSASKANPYDSVLSWKNPPVDLNIRYHFTRPVKAGLLRLFSMGSLPTGVVEVSVDGEDWQEAGRWEERRAGHQEVALTRILLPAREGAYLRLRFPESRSESFSLAEIDIWEAPKE